MTARSTDATGTITSIDGKRTITVEEFDRLFDEGSDEIDQFIDWSKARPVGKAVEVRVGQHDITGVDRRSRPSSAAE